jgi:hypothetical protein
LICFKESDFYWDLQPLLLGKESSILLMLEKFSEIAS